VLPIRRWQRVRVPGTLDISEREVGECFHQVLAGSVGIQLGSDVPVGSFLSGGLDSSSIVCLMAEFLDRPAMGRRVYSVSARYGEKGVDEKPLIDAAATHTLGKCVGQNGSRVPSARYRSQPTPQRVIIGVQCRHLA
jgi:asparagine synthase (glutamine-hydrolysing)